MSAPAVPGDRRPRRRVRRGPAATGAAILAVLVLVALLAPLIAPHDPETVDARRILAGPDGSHLFGSDSLGRDVFSRVVYALRISLLVATGSVLLASAVAVPLGALAGYVGGVVDSLISRPLDMLLVLPALLLAITLIAIVGPGSTVAALAIALIYLPILARVMRGSTLGVAHLGYVEGASARGAGHLRVLAGHVVPNAIGPVLVQVSILAGFALQIEAALSFLGLGTQPPTPSLGLMLSDGRDVLVQAPWVEVFPGLTLAMAVLGFVLVGDGLRARFDPNGVLR
ncbi:MAG: ABC transporter permease [Sporichthyaceae bacterium]